MVHTHQHNACCLEGSTPLEGSPKKASFFPKIGLKQFRKCLLLLCSTEGSRMGVSDG